MAAAPPLSPIGTSTGTQATNQSGSTTWLGGLWWQQLQPGSWRGNGFVLDAAPTKAGRRMALHEYPYKDTVWPEDLGKLPRRFQVTAFLVGDDCYQQKLAMIAACEQAGPGTLVHPTLGSMQCYLMDFTTTDRRDRGRYVEVSFEFIDASAAALAPSLGAATGNIVTGLAGALNTASQTSLGSTLSGLSPLVNVALAPVQAFANLAVSAVNDPTRALNAVTGLVGLYGRYANGNMQALQPASATVSSVLANSVVTRQAVLDAAKALVGAAGAL